MFTITQQAVLQYTHHLGFAFCLKRRRFVLSEIPQTNLLLMATAVLMQTFLYCVQTRSNCSKAGIIASSVHHTQAAGQLQHSTKRECPNS
jgi:hypothetical protein